MAAVRTDSIRSYLRKESAHLCRHRARASPTR